MPTYPTYHRPSTCSHTAGRWPPPRRLTSSGFPWIFSLITIVAAGPAAAGDLWDRTHTSELGWSDTNWSDVFGEPDPSPGVNDYVNASLVHEDRLIVGGRFTYCGRVRAPNLAVWNGDRWKGLGGGTDGQVRTLAHFEGNLVVGGRFAHAGRIPAASVARWTGTSWRAFGQGLEGYVDALQEYAGSLFAGGSVARPGEQGRYPIARWDGIQWRFESGDLRGWVNAFAVFKGDLIVAGSIEGAGADAARFVARWDGDQWKALGPPEEGPDGTVHTLEVDGDALLAGGVSGVYRWDGSRWEHRAPGTDIVSALVVQDGNIIAGGWESHGDDCYRIAKLSLWDGQRWTSLNRSENWGWTCYGWIRTLALYRGELFVGGHFRQVELVRAASVARWSGESWSSVGETPRPGHGLDDAVLAIAPYDGALIAGGRFRRAGGVEAFGLARWDGVAWYDLDSGLYRGSILALAVHNDLLIAGGEFAMWRPGVLINDIASWDGATWRPLGATTGNYSSVRALAIYDGDLIAGGNFAGIGGGSKNRIARWDGTTWHHLGGGIGDESGTVEALAVYKGDLYAAGSFSEADGREAKNIARWDGGEWGSVGRVEFGGLHAMTVYGGELIVGGSSDLARWDGVEWHAMDPPLGDGSSTLISSLGVHGGYLFVGGSFSHVGDVDAINIAAWDGSEWYVLGSGTSGTVFAAESWGDHLFVGGDFEEAGGKRAFHITDWSGRVPTRYSSPRLTIVPANPYRPQAPIQLRFDGWLGITLSIYDVRGRHIRTLLPRQILQGPVALSWDGLAETGARAPGGVYFLSAEHTDGRSRRKIVLLGRHE